MVEIKDIGRRIELITMDPHFEGISIGLYRQPGESAKFLVHSYSSKEGADERLASVRRTMAVLGGMDEDATGTLSFPCGATHSAAVRRLFLEAGKTTEIPAEARPLQTLDKKSGLTIDVSRYGSGLYQVMASDEAKAPERRIKAVANGLAKLGEMDLIDGRDDRVRYPCEQDHDALIGLLLVRAPNVRALVREQEMASSRGVLTAPSHQ